MRPLGTSIRQPPVALTARQPSGESVSAKRGDVTRLAVHHGQAVQMATVLGRKADTNGGRQRGAKL